MLNYLWGFMILIGIIYAAFTGSLTAVTNAALTSAKEAVTLCITMTGVMAFWMGLMKIAESAGIIASAAKGLRPLMRFLFPRLPEQHPAREYISANIIANLFGLGWAATPAGLKAMEALQSLNPNQDKSRASTEMCTFLIVNISSLQLIPVNIIAYRSQYGSANPARILGAAIAATLFSSMVGLLFAKVMARS